MKKTILTFSVYFMLNFMVFTPIVLAQNEAETNIEMADKMRSEGKIYVVVLVVAIVFTGLVIYAFGTDRKVSRLEKEIKSLNSTRDS